MGSCQLLTLRSPAQLPAEPSAGREAANIWMTSPRQRRGTLRRATPQGAGLSSSPSLPQPPGPAFQPPGSRAASLLHWRPGLARGHPRSSGKRHHFSQPWSGSKLQPAANSRLVNEELRPRSPRRPVPPSGPARRPGVAPTEGGTAVLADPARCPF